jgi:hypothetical protein
MSRLHKLDVREWENYSEHRAASQAHYIIAKEQGRMRNFHGGRQHMAKAEEHRSAASKIVKSSPVTAANARLNQTRDMEKKSRYN